MPHCTAWLVLSAVALLKGSLALAAQISLPAEGARRPPNLSSRFLAGAEIAGIRERAGLRKADPAGRSLPVRPRRRAAPGGRRTLGCPDRSAPPNPLGVRTRRRLGAHEVGDVSGARRVGVRPDLVLGIHAAAAEEDPQPGAPSTPGNTSPSKCSSPQAAIAATRARSPTNPTAHATRLACPPLKPEQRSWDASASPSPGNDKSHQGRRTLHC